MLPGDAQSAVCTGVLGWLRPRPPQPVAVAARSRATVGCHQRGGASRPGASSPSTRAASPTSCGAMLAPGRLGEVPPLLSQVAAAAMAVPLLHQRQQGRCPSDTLSRWAWSRLLRRHAGHHQ